MITPVSRSDLMVVAQVADDGTISTYIASQSYDTGTNTCAFTAQLLTTKS